MQTFNVMSQESAKNYFYMLLLQQMSKNSDNPHYYIKELGPIEGAGSEQYIDHDDHDRVRYRTNPDRLRVIFSVFQKAVINPLGIDDRVTYYVMYTRRWSKFWSREGNFDMKKYEGKDGILFQSDRIFNHATTNGRTPQRSAIVIITIEPSLEIHYCKISDLNMELTNKPDHHK